MENGPATAGADATVTLALPALRVTVCFWLVPTKTFPKAMDAGEKAKVPGVTVVLVPLPEAFSTVGELEASLAKERLWDAMPCRDGANVITSGIL